MKTLFAFAVLPLAAPLLGCGGGGNDAHQADAQSPDDSMGNPSYSLTVTLAGAGTGGVTSTPAGIDCGATCSTSVGEGTTVELTATPTGAAVFTGWAGACTGTGACTVTITGPTEVTASFAPRNYAFVTSTTTSGAIGGLSGADAFCQARAQAAGLPGTYHAWLSTTTTNAGDRLGSARGWIRTDGAPFADTQAKLKAALINYPLRIDELGNDLKSRLVQTGTFLNGVHHPNNIDCSGWTAADTQAVAIGNTATSGSQWTIWSTEACSVQRSLYCFGIDYDTPVVPTPPSGTVRRVFMRTWTPGGGLADADAACQSAATAASLPGTFKALLPTSSASALSRFDLSGPNWYRVDDVPVLPSAQAWSTAAYFDANPNLKADGSGTYAFSADWAGASSLTTAGTTASTCNNWTDQAVTAQTGNANINEIALFLNYSTAQQCNFTGGTITCLQQ